MNLLRIITVTVAGVLCLVGCQNATEPTSDTETPNAVAPQVGNDPKANSNQAKSAEPSSAGDQMSKKGFVEAYKSAHRKGNVEAALKLVYWEGVSPKLREGITRVFTKDFKRGLADAKLVPMKNSGPQEVETPEGIVRANLKATMELEVSFVKENTPGGEVTARKWPVGVVDGKYYFASSITK